MIEGSFFPQQSTTQPPRTAPPHRQPLLPQGKLRHGTKPWLGCKTPLPSASPRAIARDERVSLAAAASISLSPTPQKAPQHPAGTEQPGLCDPPSSPPCSLPTTQACRYGAVLGTPRQQPPGLAATRGEASTGTRLRRVQQTQGWGKHASISRDENKDGNLGVAREGGAQPGSIPSLQPSQAPPLFPRCHRGLQSRTARAQGLTRSPHPRSGR